MGNYSNCSSLGPVNIFQNLNQIPYKCRPRVWFDLRAPSISIRKHRFRNFSPWINLGGRRMRERAKWNIQSARKHALIPPAHPPIAHIKIYPYVYYTLRRPLCVVNTIEMSKTMRFVRRTRSKIFISFRPVICLTFIDACEYFVATCVNNFLRFKQHSPIRWFLGLFQASSFDEFKKCKGLEVCHIEFSKELQLFRRKKLFILLISFLIKEVKRLIHLLEYELKLINQESCREICLCENNKIFMIAWYFSLTYNVNW
jgi:hypothetical protein